MTVEISPIVLLNTARGEPEAAELWDAITDAQLADWEAEWVPETFKAVQKLHRRGVERHKWPQSRHWDWRAKVTELKGLLGAQGFSIMCGGMTQGMMTLDMDQSAVFWSLSEVSILSMLTTLRMPLGIVRIL